MAWRVTYKKPAVRDLQKLSPHLRARIKVKLEFFYAQANPLDFAQALTKLADAQYRWRVGNYRILFDVDNDLIIILRVQHRREVYR